MMKMRIVSTLLLIFISVSLHASVWPLMPQGNGHQISHYYGDYEGQIKDSVTGDIGINTWNKYMMIYISLSLFPLGD